MPAAWTFLLVLALLTLFTPFKTIGNDAWGCLFFFRNYMAPNPAWFNTGHFWSLSVEEQFYLVWPGLLLLLGNKKAAWLAGIGALGFSIYRIVNWGPEEYQNFARTPMCVDKLMIGCLLGFLLSNGRVRQSFERNGRLIFTSSFVFFLVDIEFFRRIIPLHEGILIALMIGATAAKPRMLAGRILETPFLKITGLMSYSMYLWQQFLFRDNWGPLAFIVFPLVAMLSWRFIERPGIELGAAITRRKVSPAQVLDPDPVEA